MSNPSDDNKRKRGDHTTSIIPPNPNADTPADAALRLVLSIGPVVEAVATYATPFCLGNAEASCRAFRLALSAEAAGVGFAAAAAASSSTPDARCAYRTCAESLTAETRRLLLEGRDTLSTEEQRAVRFGRIRPPDVPSIVSALALAEFDCLYPRECLKYDVGRLYRNIGPIIPWFSKIEVSSGEMPRPSWKWTALFVHGVLAPWIAEVRARKEVWKMLVRPAGSNISESIPEIRGNLTNTHLEDIRWNAYRINQGADGRPLNAYALAKESHKCAMMKLLGRQPKIRCDSDSDEDDDGKAKKDMPKDIDSAVYSIPPDSPGVIAEVSIVEKSKRKYLNFVLQTMQDQFDVDLTGLPNPAIRECVSLYLNPKEQTCLRRDLKPDDMGIPCFIPNYESDDSGTAKPMTQFSETAIAAMQVFRYDKDLFEVARQHANPLTFCLEVDDELQWCEANLPICGVFLEKDPEDCSQCQAMPTPPRIYPDTLEDSDEEYGARPREKCPHKIRCGLRSWSLGLDAAGRASTPCLSGENIIAALELVARRVRSLALFRVRMTSLPSGFETGSGAAEAGASPLLGCTLASLCQMHTARVACTILPENRDSAGKYGLSCQCDIECSERISWDHSYPQNDLAAMCEQVFGLLDVFVASPRKAGQVASVARMLRDRLRLEDALSRDEDGINSENDDAYEGLLRALGMFPALVTLCPPENSTLKGSEEQNEEGASAGATFIRTVKGTVEEARLQERCIAEFQREIEMRFMSEHQEKLEELQQRVEESQARIDSLDALINT